MIGVTPPGFDGAMDIGWTQDVTIPIAWEPQLSTDPQYLAMVGCSLIMALGATALQERVGKSYRFVSALQNLGSEPY